MSRSKRQQKFEFVLEGENRIRCNLYEDAQIKMSRALSFTGRGERARALTKLETAWNEALASQEDGADPSAVAATFYHILHS